MDGGYVIKILQKESRRFPTAGDIQNLAGRLIDGLPGACVYRIFFYHAEPYRKTEHRPLSGTAVRFADTKVARLGERLLQSLDESRDFAVRRGDLVFQGWRLAAKAGCALQNQPGKTVTGDDFVPALRQKGVDMRIGLDIAALALKRLVDTVVLVTGDADFIPAMRFARREGLRVGVCTLLPPYQRPGLWRHADFTMDRNPMDPTACAPSAPASPASGR